MRRKPPSGLPSSMPASPLVGASISPMSGELLRERRTVSEIAEYLCREIDEVEPKIEELRGHWLKVNKEIG